jgi:hypothetical protein
MDKRTFRQLHRTLAPIVMLPFAITALTGMAYRVGRAWFGLPKDRVHFLMSIHEGEYLGDTLRPFYVLLNGLGLLLMLGTGVFVLVQSWRIGGDRTARED